jgi:hypothetical protein
MALLSKPRFDFDKLYFALSDLTGDEKAATGQQAK